jgi:hypothetical protein
VLAAGKLDTGTEAGQAGQHQARLGGAAADCVSLEFGEAPIGFLETVGALATSSGESARTVAIAPSVSTNFRNPSSQH